MLTRLRNDPNVVPASQLNSDIQVCFVVKITRNDSIYVVVLYSNRTWFRFKLVVEVLGVEKWFQSYAKYISVGLRLVLLIAISDWLPLLKPPTAIDNTDEFVSNEYGDWFIKVSLWFPTKIRLFLRYLIVTRIFIRLFLLKSAASTKLG